MTMSRREFTSLTVASAAGALLSSRTARAALAWQSRFTYPDSTLPIIHAGQEILFDSPVRSLRFFKPLFSGDRSIVNPAPPRVRGHAIGFDLEGEYYLCVNGAASVKVLVLEPDALPLASVLRLFEFCVANLLYVELDDELWYARRPVALVQFFESELPLVLSCGPTHQMFQDAVAVRFGLPTRNVTLTGAVREGRNPGIEVHNTVEVYLPDLRGWMYFDINNGFTAPGLDAIALSEAAASAWSPGYSMLPSLTSRLALHVPVDTRRVDMNVYNSVARMSGRPGFRRELVSSAPMLEDRERAIRVLANGPAYWGRDSRFRDSGGTAFLPFDYTWVPTWCRESMVDAVIAYRESYGETVTLLTPTTIRALFAQGHSAQLERAEWLPYFPSLSGASV